jgi:DNA-binding MarR family transcriptional regulator
LQGEIILSATPQQCARAILDVTPNIMQTLRVQMRAQRQHDLSVPQFRTLAFLSRHPGSSLSAAAEHIGLTLPTMSVLIEGLVQRDLVYRVPDARDRRRVLLTLTAAGQSLHTAVLEGTADWLAALLEPLNEPDRAAIVQALGVLRPLFAATPALANPVED